MQKIFVADDNFSRTHGRTRAKGHTSLTINNDVDVFSSVALKTVGTSLVMEQVDKVDGDDEIYVILCKEFGLVGEEKDFRSKISVIFLDDDYMLVTLYQGAIVVNLNGNLMMPNVCAESIPPVAPDDILWINADKIKSFKKYWGTKGAFINDFELVINLKGTNANGLQRLTLNLINEECIDLSLGYVAQWEQEMKNKEDAKAAQTFASQFLNGGSTETAYEFDDDDEEEDSEEEDEDDDLYGF